MKKSRASKADTHIDCSGFALTPGAKADLRTRPTQIEPLYRSKAHYESILQLHIQALSEQQSLLYASDRHALLVIFQAMDTAGKDGAIKHVMSGVNPQGCQVFSFKQPSHLELDHDFLWRTNRCLPQRGHIGIFNRSYYEEVLVTRVHPELLDAERLPPKDRDAPHFWRDRFRSMTDLEQHLDRNGTRVVKIFLHLSREEQRRRLLKRIDDPSRNWKFSLDDLKERLYWKQYTSAYEECLEATSIAQAPWYIVPADDKRNARLIISGIILHTLRGLDLHYPQLDKHGRAQLRKLRSKLTD